MFQVINTGRCQFEPCSLAQAGVQSVRCCACDPGLPPAREHNAPPKGMASGGRHHVGNQDARCPEHTRLARRHPSRGVSATRLAHPRRSEEHTSELQSLMRISYAVFCLKKKKNKTNITLSK